MKLFIHKPKETSRMQNHSLKTRKKTESLSLLASLKFPLTFSPRLFWLCVCPVKNYSTEASLEVGCQLSGM